MNQVNRNSKERLQHLIADRLDAPANPAAGQVADEILRRHGGAVCAILFYGSCRRPDHPEGVLDFYVLVNHYREYHHSMIRSLINFLLPPDVEFLRIGGTAEPIAAKIAIISLRQFSRRMTRHAHDTSLWARFTQPATLIYADSQQARDQVITALVTAIRTACSWAAACAPHADTSPVFWTQLFGLTYGAELRVERKDRPQLIYDNDPAYYDEIFNALALGSATHSNGPLPGAMLSWKIRCVFGKIRSILRLFKAAFTFEGGVDYILWKIERHSRVALNLSPWQKRHPVLSAPRLLYRLYRRGAIR